MNDRPRIPKSLAVGKLFKNGRSQAVRIPAAFRFEGTEVEFRPGQMRATARRYPDRQHFLRGIW